MTAETPTAPRPLPERASLRARRFSTPAWRWGLAGSVLLLGTAAAVQVISSARADDTWDCTNSASLFTVTSTETTVHSIDTTTGVIEMTRTMPHEIGGVAYNPTDGLVYGWDQRARAIVQIAPDLSVTTVATSPAITRQFMSLTEIDANGQMWLSSPGPNDSSSRAWFQIDLARGSATFGDVVDSGNWAPPTGFYVPADWVMVGNALLGVAASHADPSAAPHIVGLDTATGATLDHGPVSNLISDAQFGGAWMAADGRMQLTRNSGAVVAVDLATAQAETMAENPSAASGNMDATPCGELPPPPPSTSPNTSPSATPSGSPSPGATPSASPSAAPASPPTATPTAKPTPVTPGEELAATRAGLLLHAAPHASGASAAESSSAVLTLVNSGNTELRKPTVALRQGTSTRDVTCELPPLLAAGASATCAVAYKTRAAAAISAVFTARAASGSSTLVTSNSAALPSGRNQPALTLSATSKITTHAAVITLRIENTGSLALAALDVSGVELSASEAIAPLCSKASTLIRPGSTGTCELRIPLTDLRDEEGLLPRELDLTLRAWATPIGWATPVRSQTVKHTVTFGGK